MRNHLINLEAKTSFELFKVAQMVNGLIYERKIMNFRNYKKNYRKDQTVEVGESRFLKVI